MAEGSRRRLIGIVGAPGAGKTTWATAYVAGLAAPAAYLPMDGFHLADVTLRRLGLLDRKGAPETFDAWGFAALLERLRVREPHPVYAPGFERELEQPVAAAVTVPAEAEIVVTEGNYLARPARVAGGQVGPGRGLVPRRGRRRTPGAPGREAREIRQVPARCGALGGLRGRAERTPGDRFPGACGPLAGKRGLRTGLQSRYV